MNTQIPPHAYLLIIGAMKCGTTSLYRYLEGHPEICPANTKEPEFFSTHQRHRHNVDKYQDLWDYDATVHRYAMEASTGYTKFPSEPGVPKSIHEYGIRPKFIYLVRNPFDRIVSHYNFMRQYPSWDRDMHDSHLIHVSNYFLQLQQFREYFPLDSILILDFDDLCGSPAAMLAKVYSFLDISSDYQPPSFAADNVTPTPSMLETTIERSPLRYAARLFPASLKSAIRVATRRISKPDKRLLSDDEKSRIHSLLKDDMRRLNHEYGVDVRKWGFDLRVDSAACLAPKPVV